MAAPLTQGRADIPLRIKTNSTAATASRALAASDAQMSRALERLSTGLRINRAADDAAGLSVAEQLHAQVGGLTTAGRNVQDAINVVQVADGALAQTGAIVQRMRDLAVQAMNGGAQDANAYAADAIGRIDNALQYLSVARAKLGAYQNRFEHAANVIDVSVENLSASESMIRDADMADEMTQLTRSRILAEAGTSMLAQANQAPQTLLQLLRN